MVALAAVPAAAAAAERPTALPTITRTVSVGHAQRSSCLTQRGAGRTTTTYRAPMSGFATFRLAAPRGDWDLAVFSGDRLAGASQGFRAREVVQAWVAAGEPMTIQACRRSGSARSARVQIAFVDVQPPANPVARLMRVGLRSPADEQRLEDVGFDVTHSQARGYADVLVAGDDQLAALDRLGLKHTTLDDDLGAAFQRSRRADARYAASVQRSSLPTGREGYRNYEDFGAELKALADKHPDTVKPVVIGHSYQGRELSGVEIADGVKATDGRPTYLVLALHHAREWPSAEAAMEFAHLLVEKQSSDPRIGRLLKSTRTVIVPLVNPDGYVSSRSMAPIDPSHNLYDNGVDVPLPLFGNANTAEGVAPPGGLLTFRRKNCAGDIPDPNTPCELQWGVDPNRNYGQFWGGAGSSSEAFSQSYHGPGPWSEPETQAVHALSASHQVTALITLHNVAALVLRPPGAHDQGNAPDEVRLKQLGDAMANATGYTSQFGFQLYDTTGTTEDWNYAAAGTYGYTIEMGPKDGEFHMPYKTGVVDQWDGAYAHNGKGLRDALLLAGEAAGNPADHAIIEVKAPKGSTVRLHKDFVTKTSAYCKRGVGAAPFNVAPQCVDGPYDPISVKDKLDTTTVMPKNGRLDWHVTPSTRPFVGASAKIATSATPLRTTTMSPKKTTTPNPGLPVGTGDSSEDQSFTVAQGDSIAKLVTTVKMQSSDDYDIELYYKRNGNLELVDSSAGGAGEDEVITVAYPEPGEYVLRVINYSGTQPWSGKVEQFPGQLTVTPTGVKEAWTLTCEDGKGTVLESRQVVVDRGRRVKADLHCKPKK